MPPLTCPPDSSGRLQPSQKNHQTQRSHIQTLPDQRRCALAAEASHIPDNDTTLPWLGPSVTTELGPSTTRSFHVETLSPGLEPNPRHDCDPHPLPWNPELSSGVEQNKVEVLPYSTNTEVYPTGWQVRGAGKAGATTVCCLSEAVLEWLWANRYAQVTLATCCLLFPQIVKLSSKSLWVS